MKPGDIVLTKIPQDNLNKLRPVLILKTMPGYNDLLVCAVSSQLHQFIPGFDLILEDSSPFFANSGLKASSVFRLSNLAVLPITDINGKIGSLEKILHQQLLKNLSEYLIK